MAQSLKVKLLPASRSKCAAAAEEYCVSPVDRGLKRMLTMADLVDALGFRLHQRLILVKRTLLKEATDVAGRLQEVVVQVLALHIALCKCTVYEHWTHTRHCIAPIDFVWWMSALEPERLLKVKGLAMKRLTLTPIFSVSFLDILFCMPHGTPCSSRLQEGSKSTPCTVGPCLLSCGVKYSEGLWVKVLHYLLGPLLQCRAFFQAGKCLDAQNTWQVSRGTFEAVSLSIDIIFASNG